MIKFWGKVRTHNKRGRKLGFPTANINLGKNIPEGIYISQTKIGDQKHQSLTFVGTAKTFGEKKFQAETYILDFEQNIYNQWIFVELLKKIRGNKKFNSAKELTMQMKKDKEKAIDYFNKLTS